MFSFLSRDAQAYTAHTHQKYCSFKAKFHYTSWFEAGSKLVADRFEAGRQPASNRLA